MDLEIVIAFKSITKEIFYSVRSCYLYLGIYMVSPKQNLTCFWQLLTRGHVIVQPSLQSLPYDFQNSHQKLGYSVIF